MIVANVKDLKARLNQYLRFVESGRRIIVTRRGHIVAEFVPPRKHRGNGKRTFEAVILDLAERGIVDRPTRSAPINSFRGIKVRNPKAALCVLDDLIEERRLH